MWELVRHMGAVGHSLWASDLGDNKVHYSSSLTAFHAFLYLSSAQASVVQLKTFFNCISPQLCLSAILKRCQLCHHTPLNSQFYFFPIHMEWENATQVIIILHITHCSLLSLLGCFPVPGVPSLFQVLQEIHNAEQSRNTGGL